MKKAARVKTSDSVWYSGALDVLGPLRWHLNELVEAIESHNLAATKLGKWAIISPAKVNAAKQANEKADLFFSPPKQK